MTTANCSLFEMSDDADALTLESVFKRYATFGGLHSFKFDDDIAGFVGANWTTITNVSYSSGKLARSGTLGADALTWYSTIGAHSFTLEFMAHEGRWGALLRGDANAFYYLIDYNQSTGYVRLIKYQSGNYILLSRQLRDWELVTKGRVQIMCRDAQATSDSQGRILYFSAWLNDIPILSWEENLPTSNPPLRWGLLIPSGTAGDVYSDLRVANLNEPIVWSSLDPGEAPMGAIQRAMEDRYIRMWMRWDGSLRAWIPKARTLSRQITPSNEFGLQSTTDLRQVFSHVRVLGAFQWVQAVDNELLRRVGNKFREVQNTNLWNVDDCYRVAQHTLMRSKEQANQVQIVTYGMIFHEVEDRIQVSDRAAGYIDYIIDTIRWQYSPGTFQVNVAARGYYYT